MTDFKVGDKVRFLKFWEGEGTVISTTENLWPIRVEHTNGKIGSFNWHELELVKPKVRIGDWVKVQGFGTPGRCFEGRVGRVSYVGNDCATLDFRDPKLYNGTFALKYLVPAEAPQPVFKVGDKVRQKAGVYGHSLGDSLTVTDVYDFGRYSVTLENRDGVKLGYQPSELEHIKPLSSTVNLDNLTCAAIDKFDSVNNVSHYGGKDNPFEVIKVAEAWGFEKNAYLFNALKYLARAGKKGSKVEDLEKLVYFAQREIAIEKAKK